MFGDEWWELQENMKSLLSILFSCSTCLDSWKISLFWILFAVNWIFEKLGRWSHVHFFNPCCECISWLCKFLLASYSTFFRCHGLAKTMWTNGSANCTRNCNGKCYFICGRIAFQVMVAPGNCSWSWISSWNHNFRAGIFFLAEVCLLCRIMFCLCYSCMYYPCVTLWF